MPKTINPITLNVKQASVVLDVLEGELGDHGTIMLPEYKGRLEAIVADMRKQMGPSYVPKRYLTREKRK